MQDTDVIMMSAKRDGMSEFMLGQPPEIGGVDMIDLREKRRVPLFRDAFQAFFGNAEGSIRVISDSPVIGQDALELIIPKEKLQWAMRDYFKRIAKTPKNGKVTCRPPAERMKLGNSSVSFLI